MTVTGQACLVVLYDPNVSEYTIGGIEYGDPQGGEIELIWYSEYPSAYGITMAKGTDYTFTAGAKLNDRVYQVYSEMTIKLTSAFMAGVVAKHSSTIKISRKTLIMQPIKYMAVHSDLGITVEASLDKLTRIAQEGRCKINELDNLSPIVGRLEVDNIKNKADISTNKADIATNKANIATNTASIGTNATNIAANTASITTNTTNISNNISSINTLKTDVATNKTNIATNTAGIATNKAGIATNTAGIATNKADITTLKTFKDLFPDTVNSDKGSLLVVNDKAKGTLEIQAPSVFIKELMRNVLGTATGVNIPAGSYEYVVDANGNVTFSASTASASSLPDTTGKAVGSLLSVKDPVAKTYELKSRSEILGDILSSLYGGATSIPEGHYILNVSDTGAASLITDRLPSGTFADNGKVVALKLAPDTYELKTLIGLPDPSGAQAGQSPTLVDPATGTFQYSDVIFGSSTGATKGSVLVIDDETFATTAFLAPAAFLENLLRIILGTADADLVPSGSYVVSVDSKGAATFKLLPTSEDYDQSSGVLKGLKLADNLPSLGTVKVTAGTARFVQNVEGIPTAASTDTVVAADIVVTIPAQDVEYFVYLNKDGTTAVNNVRTLTPRGDQILIGSVRSDSVSGLPRIAQLRRILGYMAAQFQEFLIRAGKNLEGGAISKSVTSITNQIKITSGYFIRIGGNTNPNSFYTTPIKDRDPMKWRFLTNGKYSSIYQEFPLNPPTLVSGVANTLAKDYYGIYLVFVDVRQDIELTTTPECSITILPAVNPTLTKPNAVWLTAFNNYYTNVSSTIPTELNTYGKLIGMIVYKGEALLNSADVRIAPLSIEQVSSHTNSGTTSLPTGTVTDTGKAVVLTTEPSTYGLAEVIKPPTTTAANVGQGLYLKTYDATSGAKTYDYHEYVQVPATTALTDVGKILALKSYDDTTHEKVFEYQDAPSGGSASQHDFEEDVIEEALTLVNKRVIKPYIYPSQIDVFSKNMAWGLYVKASQTSSTIQDTDKASVAQSLSYFGATVDNTQVSNMVEGKLYRNLLANKFETPSFTIDYTFPPFTDLAGLFDSTYDFNITNHTKDPIKFITKAVDIVLIANRYKGTVYQPLWGFRKKTTSSNIMTTIVKFKVVNKSALFVDGNVLYIYAPNNVLTATSVPPYNKTTTKKFIQVVTQGTTITFKQGMYTFDGSRNFIDFVANGTSVITATKVFTWVDIPTFESELATFMKAEPTFFKFECDLSLPMETGFLIGIYSPRGGDGASVIIGDADAPVTGYGKYDRFFCVTSGFNSSPSPTLKGYELEWDITESDTTVPADHTLYELGTLKSIMALPANKLNASTTVTADKKIIATLSTIEPHPAYVAGYVFDTSKYDKANLPSISIEKADKSDIVHFSPQALSPTDIIYKSIKPITQAMIDTYIVRVRIESDDKTKLQINAKDNIHISFVDEDKF